MSAAQASPVNGRAVPARRLWWLAAAFAVWCSALVALYALHAIGCAFAWPTGTLRVILAIVFVAHLVVGGWIWRNFANSGPDPTLDPTGSFLHVAIAWTAIAAFASSVLVFGPAFLLTTCV